ncbi:AAA family ATPase [Arcobacter sp. YIC-80]|uniref:AAA family ATPase n=1 Tax=Arcobacter sp. YIC-80 TaxID=3376683 RepID=UPI00384FAFAD
MRINKVIIQDFKNLKDFEINFDKSKMKTVLLGQNASGKSNFIEAVLLIFKFLDLSTSNKRDFPLFSYTINYEIKNNIININCDHENKNYKININNNSKDETYKNFFSDESKKIFQPKYVFTYYSGLSNRLKEHFWDHQEKFYEKIIDKNFNDKELDSLRKLFYVQLVHSYFVLLAYFSFEEEEKESIQFLSEVLNIKDIESILFILKKPTWGDRDKDNPNDRFWNANGLVRNFLNFLWENSLAPIYHQEPIKTDFREETKQDRLYLYISSKEKLKKLANNYKSNTEFFKALESTYISKLMEEVRIKVKKENTDGSITFKELSEGEQQLLTVLGLLKFTKDEDSLILLDEPDTHLNPLWKWQYFEFLDKVVKNHNSTQIIINTHDPLVIGNLTKEEVRIFKNINGIIETVEPDIDPRGLGVAGILTSELFGLSTTLDPYTMSLINEKMEITIIDRKLTEKERERLKDINNELESFGLNYDKRFPDIEECLKEKFKKRSKIKS